MNCDGHACIDIVGRVSQAIPDEFETCKHISQSYVSKTWGSSDKKTDSWQLKQVSIYPNPKITIPFFHCFSTRPIFQASPKPPPQELFQLPAWLAEGTAAALGRALAPRKEFVGLGCGAFHTYGYPKWIKMVGLS